MSDAIPVFGLLALVMVGLFSYAFQYDDSDEKVIHDQVHMYTGGRYGGCEYCYPVRRKA